jgi:two-component system chemotaxis response regulator CheY
MKKILIVDDATFIRVSLRKMLEKNNFNVIGEAVDGIDAVEKVKSLNPDLVTLDITMPKMNGIDALAQILEMDPTMKIVMVSALGQEDYVKKAILSGAKHFIVKPFKEETVVGVIEKLLQE